MIEKTHDPSEYVRGLQQLLVSDKKKIAFLFGAGTSLAKKNERSIIVPAIDVMTAEIEKVFDKEEKFSKAIEEMRDEIHTRKEIYNIETLLSHIENKVQIIGKGTLNELVKNDFEELLKRIKNNIREITSIHNQIIKEGKIDDLIHVDFAEWIGRAKRKYPIEIFTSNYDYLLELGLENRNIPFYDGFTGTFKPFFNAESVEDMGFIPNQTKLWKIHGSLGWHYDDKTGKVWRKDSDGEDILIYPSSLKYNESKKQPYTAFLDRLTNFLKQPDTILIVCGYSFSDEHINERIITALNANTSAHVLVLYYDRKDGKKEGYLLSEDSKMSKIARTNGKLSVYGFRSAVIGGQYGKWKLKREPDKYDTINVNTYFDEDAPCSFDDKKNEEKKGDEAWTGEGELILPDFSKFIKFLLSMILDDKFGLEQISDE